MKNITYVLNWFEYPPDVTTEEWLGSDYYYRTLVQSVNEAERFNYHSDYWGDADEYQEDNVVLMEELEPYIGERCYVEKGEDYLEGTLEGILIDKQYNSISHTCILFSDVAEEKTVKEAMRKKADDAFYGPYLVDTFLGVQDAWIQDEGGTFTWFVPADDGSLLDFSSDGYDSVEEAKAALSEKYVIVGSRKKAMKKCAYQIKDVSLGDVYDYIANMFIVGELEDLPVKDIDGLVIGEDDVFDFIYEYMDANGYADVLNAYIVQVGINEIEEAARQNIMDNQLGSFDSINYYFDEEDYDAKNIFYDWCLKDVAMEVVDRVKEYIENHSSNVE